MDFQSQLMDETIIEQPTWTPEELFARAKTETENPNQAMALFLQAAQKGHADAMHAVGFHYEKGRGCDKNLEKAVRWYESAAALDHADAMYRLGQLYGSESGHMDDACLEALWYKKGAALGHAGCLYRTGLCYFHGTGVPKHEQKGYFLVLEAAEAGHDEAKGFIFAYNQMKKPKAEEAAQTTASAASAASANALELLRTQIETGIATVKEAQRDSHRELLGALNGIHELLAARPSEVSTPAPKRKADVPAAPLASRKRALQDEMEDVLMPATLPSTTVTDDAEFWDTPAVAAVSTASAKHPRVPRASRCADPSGTLYRYYPAHVPHDSEHNHYTAVAMKDGSVLQVKSLLGIRTVYASVDAWLQTIPGQPTYLDLDIEHK